MNPLDLSTELDRVPPLDPRRIVADLERRVVEDVRSGGADSALRAGQARYGDDARGHTGLEAERDVGGDRIERQDVERVGDVRIAHADERRVQETRRED